MRKKSSFSLATVTALLIALTPMPAGARKARGLEGRDCTMVQVPVDTPAELVRPFVPAPFVLDEDLPGHVFLGVNTTRCKDFRVGGKSVGPGGVSEAFAGIESPDGSAGIHDYLLWQITDVPAIRSLAEGKGLAGELVDAITVDVGPAPAGGQAVSLSVPGDESIGGTALEPDATASMYRTETFAWTMWHKSADGVLRMPRFENYTWPSTVNEADGEFHSAPTSRLTVMMGTAAQPMQFFVFHDYEFKTTTKSADL